MSTSDAPAQFLTSGVLKMMCTQEWSCQSIHECTHTGLSLDINSISLIICTMQKISHWRVHCNHWQTRARFHGTPSLTLTQNTLPLPPPPPPPHTHTDTQTRAQQQQQHCTSPPPASLPAHASSSHKIIKEVQKSLGWPSPISRTVSVDVKHHVYLGFGVELRLSFLFKNVVVCGHCLVTLPITVPTETLEWLLSLPILMQESFWWRQCSDRYIISFSPHLHTPVPVPNKPYGFCGC